MGLIAWIVFGALAGWVANKVTDTDQRRGCLVNVIVGVVGALIGGIIMMFVTGRPFHFGFDLPSFVVAVLGAIVLLVVVGMSR